MKAWPNGSNIVESSILDDVAHCWARWPNECNKLDSTLLERSESNIGLSKKMARDRSTVKRCLAALALLEMLPEEDDRVTKRKKTRHWIKRRGEKGYFNNII